MPFFDNTRKPMGFGGKVMVVAMNLGHRALADWGLSFGPAAFQKALDCGCGGGANLKKLLKCCPGCHVTGADYSAVSVEKSQKVNRRAIEEGRCQVVHASVATLPFPAEVFDLVTAFETVYFWPDLPACFREIWRLLTPGGTFLICNECGGNDQGEQWEKRIGGMKIYRAGQLKALLEESGFRQLQIHQNARGWLCITAQK